MKNSGKKVYFLANKSELSKVFKQLKAGVPKSTKIKTTCELTLTNKLATFITPGAIFSLEVISVGSAKVAFDLISFARIVNSFNKKELKIEIGSENIVIETFHFKAQSTFFENDNILRSISLPINYTDIDLLALSFSKKYTIQELKFNKLWPLVSQAEQNYKQNLKNASFLFQQYGVTINELELLLKKKIQKRIDSMLKSLNFNQHLQS